MLVYGNARFNKTLLSPGSVITAKVKDSALGNCSVIEDGAYSMLLYYDGEDYTPVEFYISGGKATQVLPFVADTVIGLDLDFVAFKNPDPAESTSTTLFIAPAVSGNAVSVTLSDSFLGFIFIVLLLSIAYSITDILTI